MKRAYVLFAIILSLFASVAQAQNPGTVTANAFAIGKGAGVTGYSSLLCSAGQLAVGQAGAPVCRTVSGDATFSAAGALTFNNVNSNVGSFGDGTHVGQFTVDAKGRITAASSVLVTGAPPTGAAGGALSGTYPNPLLATMLANTTLCNATAGVAVPTNCNAATMRTNIGVSATGADTTYNFRANNLSDVASVATARTNLGVSATGADTTYNFRANNLSDVANAATARTNLGVSATGADTTYAFRANNLSDLASVATARTNLGLVIGTNVEAWDADLDCLAALATTGMVKRTGAGTCSAGTVAVADGGTGLATLTANAFLTGNGTGNVNTVAITGLVLGNGVSAPTAYGGTSACANQFMTALSAVGAATCTTPVLASAQYANQGTTTTVLHGNAAGNPSFGPVSLTADVANVLPAANGGAGTINGALKANGSGIVSQANCASLSDAAASCSTLPKFPITNTSGNISIVQNTTSYIANGLEAGSAVTPLLSPMNATASAFCIAGGSTPAAGQTFTFTLQIAGSPTTLVVTLTNGQFSGCDNTHTTVVTAGNAMDVKVVTSATSGSIANGFGYSFMIQ